MEHVLVTGGAGYIGSACVEYLLDLGYKVTVFDALLTGHRDAVDPRAEFIRGHLADREGIIALCRERKFDAVMHFAAFSLVGESMKDPSKYFVNNLCCAVNLADAAVAGGARHFVFSSTAATFGQPERVPIREDDRQKPINPYGESKLCFEKVLHWYSEIYGMKYTALRYFNAAGATELHGEDHRPESHLIPLILQTIRGKRDKLLLYGDDYPTPDGTCVRDYIHITDLADAHIRALDYLKKGGKSTYYNLGNGNGFSVKEVIDMTEKVTGLKIKRQVEARRPGDPATLVASSAKIKKELGWNPQYDSLESIIASAWKWHSTHKNGYNK